MFCNRWHNHTVRQCTSMWFIKIKYKSVSVSFLNTVGKPLTAFITKVIRVGSQMIIWIHSVKFFVSRISDSRVREFPAPVFAGFLVEGMLWCQATPPTVGRCSVFSGSTPGPRPQTHGNNFFWKKTLSGSLTHFIFWFVYFVLNVGRFCFWPLNFYNLIFGSSFLLNFDEESILLIKTKMSWKAVLSSLRPHPSKNLLCFALKRFSIDPTNTVSFDHVRQMLTLTVFF